MHIITMLFLLSILILVHEFGHFIVARRLGIKVEKFGFGLPFGPVLYEKMWGQTKICVHAFLLGGYVSFPDDEPDSEIPKDSQERIANRKVWERFLVVSAGVTANAIVAYFIVLLVAGFSGGVPSGKYDIYIDQLQSDKTLSSHQIGIKPGDQIITVNNTKIDTLYKFVETAQRSKKFDNYASDERYNENFKKIKELNPDLSKYTSQEGLIEKGTVVKIPQSSPEEPVDVPIDFFAGYKTYKPTGKLLTQSQRSLRNSIYEKLSYISNGEVKISDLALALSDSVHPINIVISRDDRVIKLPSAYPNQNGVIGVKLRVQEVNVQINSPLDAVVKSWDYLQRNASYMVTGLWMIITGQIPLSDIHGIVAVTKIGSDIIEKRGIWDGLLLTALISIDLAIVNLLPIPALDGGHLLFLLIEKLRGRPVEEKVQEAFAKYGFAFLLGLMILIIFNDIFALLTDKL